MITNPGVSSSGQPCVVPIVTQVPVDPTKPKGATIPTITGYTNTGLQYYHTTQQQANVWYHWSNLAKIQWNHVFNDKLFAQFRLAENFNQYIFDQPFSLATINGVTTRRRARLERADRHAEPRHGHRHGAQRHAGAGHRLPGRVVATAARRCTSRTST